MRPSFLVIDKPPGITSHDVVAAVRAVTGAKKVGHTGTLDPFATGVLALALGPATRLVQFVDESMKVYDATIAFGCATDTGDPTGETVEERPKPTATWDEVEAVLSDFLGKRMQTPPAYSAVKHKGKPLYWYARRGIQVEVAAREITIHDLELVEYDADHLRVVITCSRGTYARVLAGEIATALGSAGHLCALARRRSGPFFLDDAVSMDQLAAVVSAEPDLPWQRVLMGRRGEERVPWRPRDEVREAIGAWLTTPIQALAHLPLVDVDGPRARAVRNGGPPGLPPAGVAVGGRYLLAAGDELVAIAERAAGGGRVLRVLDSGGSRAR